MVFNPLAIEHILVGGWYTYPSEKIEFINWNDNIPNWMEKEKKFQTTNQMNWKQKH